MKTTREWLIENDYEDVAELINQIMTKWKTNGKLTRRNWWDVLAGGKNGSPKIIEGIEFPVLKAAQIRQGKDITTNAICRNSNEIVPQPRANNKWTTLKKNQKNG